MAPPSQTHFCIFHGAYHTSWHLQLFKKNLESYGYAVSTPNLPSSGSYVSLRDDVDVHKATLESAARTHEVVIPVFHSYAAIPGGDALAEISDPTKAKIPIVVHLAALMLPQGKPLSKPDGAGMAGWAVADGKEGKFRVVPDPVSCFYNDVEPQLAEEAAKHVVPHSMAAFCEPTRHCGWKDYKSIYVMCLDDLAVARSLVWERLPGMLEQMGVKDRWELTTIEGGHSPFLGRIEETSKLLRRAAGHD